MPVARHRELETLLDEALDERRYEAAATIIIRSLGPEVLRLLVAIHRDQDDASEVFSKFAEALWKALPAFERRSSVRSWTYAIARMTSLRHRRDGRRRNRRIVTPTRSSILRRAEVEVRTATLSFLRTERRSQLTALRESLAPEDQTLLILRVDRELSWEELAVVLGMDPNLSGAQALKREAARLRKRFQIVKSKLRKQALELGLLSPGG